MLRAALTPETGRLFLSFLSACPAFGRRRLAFASSPAGSRRSFVSRRVLQVWVPYSEIAEGFRITQAPRMRNLQLALSQCVLASHARYDKPWDHTTLPDTAYSRQLRDATALPLLRFFRAYADTGPGDEFTHDNKFCQPQVTWYSKDLLKAYLAVLY